MKRAATVGITIALAVSCGSTMAAAFEWVNGTVTSFTAQRPKFTVATVNNRPVRFCDETTGVDYPINAANIHWDMLKSAFLNGKKVQVGVQNFGNDPQAGIEKLCIDRVILTN